MSNNLIPGFIILIILIIFIFINKAKSSLKNDIEQDAKKFFGAKEDLSGNLILEMQGYTIFLDYDLAYDTRGMAEYVIANVVLPKLNAAQLRACKKIIDIRESDGKFYAIIYASWGYQGEKFRSRLEQKLHQISSC